MDREIKRLRKKFFLLSSSIAFTVIFLVMLVLNTLMRMSFQTELKSASDMLIQTAYTNVSDISSEIISLSGTEKNEAGDSLIFRDPSTIESIKLIGTITCTDENAGWYCAGGGVYFEMPDKAGGDPKFIHKEYKFNKDNNEITIELADNDDFMVNGSKIKANISDVSKDRFYVSCVWWASSSENSEALKDNSVKLDITDIEIQYLDNVTIGTSENYEPLVRDFSDLDQTSIPDTLNNYNSFYFITDMNDNIIEINNGNSMKVIDKEKAREMIKSGGSKYIIDDTGYTCTIKDNGTVKVCSYISNSQAQQSNERLLVLSVLSGGGMFIILLGIIYLFSGRAVRPISQSYSKQKEFISNASHELKLPITVISATADLMEKKNGPDRLIDCIYAQVRKMGRLVNEMLSLSRLSEPKKYDDSFEQFDISRTVNNSLLYFESRAFEEKRQIVSEIEDGVSVRGVPEKIGDLIDILIDNALKYSDENSDIKVILKKVKGRAVFICMNPCSNFDENDLPHLFDRFYRGDKAHSNETEGFGLGLSIAKETMELHNGSIKAEYIDGNVLFTAEF